MAILSSKMRRENMAFKNVLSLAIITAIPFISVNAQSAQGSPLIDYGAFLEVSREVQPYRAKRLVSLKYFMQRTNKPDVLLLDARSESAFAQGHIAGAINLPLPDFTPSRLAEVIGKNTDREILIYCNNNFRNNIRPVETKATPLALNISTFVNLYGYGYTNVYELGEAVDMNDPAIGWVSS
jgi:phage shock protein E